MSAIPSQCQAAVRLELEGAITMGISAALLKEITVKVRGCFRSTRLCHYREYSRELTFSPNRV